MGEKLDYLEKSTAPQENKEHVDEESFLKYSQRSEGLSLFSEDSLKKFIYTRDNFEDILYIFKFISDKEVFSEISSKKESSFENLNEKDFKQVKEFAKLFHGFLKKPPLFCENKAVEVGDKGDFLAYINKTVTNQRLDVSWKNKDSEEHIFNKLLQKANTLGNTLSQDYPNILRSYGEMEIYLDQDNIINIRFSGDASKECLSYAPGYLKGFKKYFEEFFKEKFKTEEVKLHF